MVLENEDIIDLFNPLIRDLKIHIVKKLGTPDQMEDVLHETYLRLVKVASHIEEQSFSGLAFTIAGNIAIDFRRKASVRSKYIVAEYPEDNHKSEQLTPEQIEISNQKLERINAAIARIPEKYQEIIRLRLVHDLNQREIAEKLKISYTSTRKRMQRAIEHLRSYLVDDE
ncbi:MAG: RNA polymerase sigma factor [Gammaproteobacteria bacterium]|nr:MAG: RNA polymerase sigma factor [Gammaproteobacteria bacterium]